jgi:hypothetical protein
MRPRGADEWKTPVQPDSLAAVKPHRGRAVAIVAAVIAVLVLLGTGFLVARRARWLPDQVAPRQRVPLPPAGKIAGQRVDIATGTIELVDFLRFLGDYTDLPVIHDATDPRITGAKLHVAAPMKDVDAELVRSFIEASGFSVEVETQENGRQVIRVEVMRSRGPP